MLTLDNISKTFYPGTPNERRAIQNLTLHLDAGEFVTIIGSNGAGKSTLFNLVAGSLIPDSGHIWLDIRGAQEGANPKARRNRYEEERVTYLQEHKRSRYLGRLFQDPTNGTAPHMTIEENLALAYLRAGKRRGPFSRISAEDRRLFREKLAALGLGLEDRMKLPVGLLSGGQRQSLALLMATVIPPRVLLLDEHTAALDPATAEIVLQLTRKAAAEHNVACMMITHNISSALAIGTRTLMMDSGGIVLDVAGAERDAMTVEGLLEAFRQRANKKLDTDRVLLED